MKLISSILFKLNLIAPFKAMFLMWGTVRWRYRLRSVRRFRARRGWPVRLSLLWLPGIKVLASPIRFLSLISPMNLRFFASGVSLGRKGRKPERKKQQSL